ncbi:hypothetical protein LIS04_157 [Listeria phage LIS04]|nr:hypothetical protein LIS04_157 [Listeria phage LIS04]
MFILVLYYVLSFIFILAIMTYEVLDFVSTLALILAILIAGACIPYRE